MKSPTAKLPPPSSILIRDGRYVLTDKGPISNKSIYVNDRKILDIGDTKSLLRRHGVPDLTVDASTCIVMPGLVNNHSHIAMSLLRGYAEDLPLLEWLHRKIWPAEAKLSPEDIHLGALVGCAESLLSGTTTITTIYFYDHKGSEAHAIAETGIRGLVAHGIFDRTRKEGLAKTELLARDWHGHDSGRVRVATSPHAPYSCSPELLKEIESLRTHLNERYGSEYRVLNTLHVSEARNEVEEIEKRYRVDAKSGVAKYLDSLGVLNEETICAHSIHFSSGDYESMVRTKASIASCPVSNLKVGMGIADLPRAISSGLTVSLGTDGPASNNSLDMFETIKMASLLPKGTRGDTTLMDARTTFQLATIGGAKSMHVDQDAGSLATGKKADIVIVDLSAINSEPVYDPYSHLVYAAKASEVKDVIVDGRLLVQNRKLIHLNVERLKSLTNRAIKRLGFLPR
jgi:5-methylthioadenosine/S-adenosylhomocysteine deaminase